MLQLKVRSCPEELTNAVLENYVVINTNDFIHLFKGSTKASYLSVRQMTYRVIPDSSIEQGEIAVGSIQRLQAKLQIGAKVYVKDASEYVSTAEPLKEVTLKIDFLSESHVTDFAFNKEDFVKSATAHLKGQFLNLQQKLLFLYPLYKDTRFILVVEALSSGGGSKKSGLSTESTQVVLRTSTVSLEVEKYVVYDYEFVDSGEAAPRTQLTEEETKIINQNLKSNFSQKGCSNFLFCMDGENLRLYVKCSCLETVSLADLLDEIHSESGVSLRRTGFEEIDEEDFSNGILTERNLE